jgi:phosphopantetheine--protein transferase-like protein
MIPLHDWVCNDTTPVGIGIDLVSISELKELNRRIKGAFFKCVFTKQERLEAERRAERWCYLAGRFAAKEAAFKAITPLISGKPFDFRIIETLTEPDGSPKINCTEPLKEVMDEAGIERLLVTISNQDDYAIAMVQAVRIRESKDL